MDILSSFISKDNISNLTIAICVDLSRPGSLIDEINEWIALLVQNLNVSFQEKLGLQDVCSI